MSEILSNSDELNYKVAPGEERSEYEQKRRTLINGLLRNVVADIVNVKIESEELAQDEERFAIMSQTDALELIQRGAYVAGKLDALKTYEERLKTTLTEWEEFKARSGNRSEPPAS